MLLWPDGAAGPNRQQRAVAERPNIAGAVPPPVGALPPPMDPLPAIEPLPPPRRKVRMLPPISIAGDLFTFVDEGVKANRLRDSEIKGFPFGKETFRDVSVDGGVLIGFELRQGRFVNNEIIDALRPIYRTRVGEKSGPWHGPPAVQPVAIKAKPGYVVGAVSLRAGLVIDGISVTFVKLGKERLDLMDTYDSPWVGGQGGNASVIGGEGALFVGVCGRLGNRNTPCALGLVALLPKE